MRNKHSTDVGAFLTLRLRINARTYARSIRKRRRIFNVSRLLGFISHPASTPLRKDVMPASTVV
jgi:hypothetical protein